MAQWSFWQAAKRDPDHLALVEPDGRELTAGELLAGANRVVHGLRALGLAAGDTVGTLLPNSAAPLIVAATLAVGNFIILEAFLSFLGLGIQAPTPSWGNLLQDAQSYSPFITDINPTKEIRGYLILFPGLMILLTVLSINFMGDALRDALDPRLKM